MNVTTKRSYVRRPASELQEERDMLRKFVRSTFDDPANFPTELRHLFDENYGSVLAQEASASVTELGRGNFRARIVEALAKGWGVPFAKVLAAYRGLPQGRQRALDSVVDMVVEERFGLDLLNSARTALAPKLCSLSIPAAPGERPVTGAAVLDLWASGKTLKEIAATYFTTQTRVRNLLREIRLTLRYGAVPDHARGRRFGTLSRSPMNELRNPGDFVTLSKSEGGSRQNVHNLAKTRGWKVKIAARGDTWHITARYRRPQMPGPSHSHGHAGGAPQGISTEPQTDYATGVMHPH